MAFLHFHSPYQHLSPRLVDPNQIVSVVAECAFVHLPKGKRITREIQKKHKKKIQKLEHKKYSIISRNHPKIQLIRKMYSKERRLLLTESNYTAWKIVATSLLKSRNLWTFCESKLEAGENEEETEAILQSNEEAKHLLYMTMEADQIMATGVCPTAFDVWLKIEENHEGAESRARSDSLADFLGFKFIKGESLIAYCGRYELALGRLQASGYQIEEDTKFWVFRNSSPKDIQATTNMWSIARPEGTVSELISQLKIQFHSEKNDDETSALYSSCRNASKQQKQFDQSRTITLGNGKTILAHGEGNMAFESGSFSGTLYGIPYVPQIQENLLSVSTAASKGNDVKFYKNPPFVEFLRGDKIVLRGSRLENGVYGVDLKPMAQNNSLQAFVGASLEEWHERFCHCSPQQIDQLLRHGAEEGLKIDNKASRHCVDCVKGKITRCPHKQARTQKANFPGEILHLDTCGPLKQKSLGGSKYFVLAVDELSTFKFIEFVENKSQIPDVVKRIITICELNSGRPVKQIITDNGGEYVNTNLEEWLKTRGVLHLTSACYTPGQNGKVERANRTVIEAVRTMLSAVKFVDGETRESLWAEAANAFIYTHNRLLATNSPTKTRFEILTGKRPSVKNLHRFGQPAILKSTGIKMPKFAKQGSLVYFVGYTERSNTYRFYDPQRHKVCVACDVVFLESDPNIDPALADKREFDIMVDSSSTEPGCSGKAKNSTVIVDRAPTVEMSTSGPENQQDNGGGAADVEAYWPDFYQPCANNDRDDDLTDLSSSLGNIIGVHPNEDDATAQNVRAGARETRSTLNLRDQHIQRLSKRLPNRANLALISFENEPQTLAEAKDRSDWPHWERTISEELGALDKNGTWIVVEREPHMRPIKNKWVLKLKRDDKGIPRYKARLVAKGFTQIPEIDFKETYAPVAGMTTIRLFLSIANKHDLELLQFDVRTAFLYGELEEEIFMEMPDGQEQEGKVCKLVKSLYGLKQSPRCWNKRFSQFLAMFNLTQSRNDACLYYNKDKSILLIIYVDDGIIAAKCATALAKIVDHLESEFELKTMECGTYLGVQINRDRKKRTILLNQSTYIQTILDKFGMSDCNAACTPEELKSDFESSPPLENDQKFKQLVGNILYLVSCTRPDVAHALSMASRTPKPTEAHWNALKRILRYLKGSSDFGIQFSAGKAQHLIGYSDADHANDSSTRRSNTGYCIFYGGGPISWKCARQPIVTLSTTEAEYVSGCELTKQLIPIRELLIELGDMREGAPAKIMIDNLSTIKIAKDESAQHRTKHIDVRAKWLTEQFHAKKITIDHIRSDEQVADILTKPLAKTKFIKNQSLIMTSMVLLSLVCMVSSLPKFQRTDPLTFASTEIPYIDGIRNYKILYKLENPCARLFRSATANEITNSHSSDLCNYDYRKLTETFVYKCHKLDTNAEHPYEVDKTINVLDQHTREYDPESVTQSLKVAQERVFRAYRALMWELEKSSAKQRIPLSISKSLEILVWEESSIPWTDLHDCHVKETNSSIEVFMNLTVPVVDPTVRVLKAVAFNVLNATKRVSREDQLCWMVYNGPDLVMINTTNMCMTEIFDWDLSDGSIKGITCEDPTKGLRTT